MDRSRIVLINFDEILIELIKLQMNLDETKFVRG